MADGTVARTSEAPGFVKVRLKPEIYRTTDGKVIVEDEFLHFLYVKLKTLSQDEIILLASNTFDSEWIEMSKKALFDLCDTSQRNVSHKGTNKDVNNIKACLKVMNECGDTVPRFVSHYLDELPPVTFTSMDVCGLLRKLEHLHAEVSTMRHTLNLQAEASESLRAVTVDVSNRVCALELRTGHGGTGLRAAGKQSGAVDSLEGETRVVDSACSLTQAEDPLSSHGERPSQVEFSGGTTLLPPSSPKWSKVVKSGQQRFAKPAPRIGLSTSGQRKVKTVVGTGATGNFKMIKTKLVSVFASKFSPDLEAETLRTYLKNKLGHDVSCDKIDTVNDRYASFKVTAECNTVDVMYDPELWPDGTFVRRYYEPRKAAAVIGANAAVATLGAMSAPVAGSSS